MSCVPGIARDAAAGTPEEKGPWYKNDEAAQSQLFAAKAAGYGSFILVLYFLLGATLCLCNMRSKKVRLREGKGYIAVPACEGSLAEAKHAFKQTSPF
eukprot:1160015-Pelagomonas_calceolata.AAC.1